MPQVLRFPSCFESHEQDYIIEEAKKMGLNGKSVGKNCNKHVSVTRPVQYTEVRDSPLTIQPLLVEDAEVLIAELDQTLDRFCDWNKKKSALIY